MGQTVVVRGTLNDPRHIELDEPVSDISGPVEVKADGTHRVVIEVPQKFEKGFRSTIRHVIGNHECTLCKQITGKQCGACASYYCSKECLKNDWKRHKPEWLHQDP